MNKKTFIGLGAGIALVILVAWGFIEGRKEYAQEQARERPVQVPSRVVAQGGGTAVVFDAATQKRADIVVAPAQTVTRSAEVEVLAMVLPAQELVDLRNAIVAARTQADKATAALNASRREYERVKALYGDEQNLSLKTLETAEATWRADEAAARGAREALDAATQGARQKWGGALASAIADNAPLFRRLAEQQDVLLRVATPSGSGVTKAPATIRIAADDGSYRSAHLISASPQADPRIQGATFFYAAPANGLLPGTTLAAYLPSGAAQNGAIVPATAVVWWQGKAWIYQRSAQDRFARKELPAAVPIEQGWFVPGMREGTELVVRGAQTLLSEELRAQIQVGEEGK